MKSLLTKLLVAMALTAVLHTPCAAEPMPYIEVTGSATLNIVPDRITVEIAMEEYYKRDRHGDSTLVSLSEIEKGVRRTLRGAGVPDSLIVVAGIGNYRADDADARLLMGKRIAATIDSYESIDRIAERLDRLGIRSFNITSVDNSDMSSYNRQGLKAALDAAREKAEFMAETVGLKIIYPEQTVENGPNYYETPAFSNVSFDNGAGMQNMRRIVRRYSVKVRYACNLR